MIFALGILAALQMAVLPGLLLTRRLRLISTTERGIAIFAGSLLFNYVLAGLLTACRQYRHQSVIAVLVFEGLLLAWTFLRKQGQPSHDLAPMPRGDDLSDQTMLTTAAMAISLVVVALMGWRWQNELGKVFESFDAIASWNRWALEWSANQWPHLTWNYPQLLPANWSLAYVITGGKEGEIFARGLMGAFPLLILLGIFDLQRRLREPWLAVAVVAASVLLSRCIANLLFEGYADAPVAALSFAGVYFQLLAREENGAASRLLAAAICYGAACVTKQAGWLVLIPALIWQFTDGRLRAAGQRLGKTGKVALALLLLCALHWYVIHALVSSQNGDDALLVHELTVSIHKGRGLLERTAFGFSQLSYSLQPSLLCGTMALLLLASLAEARGARLFLYFTAPALIVWLLAFSYDIRNLAVALPTAALAMGFGAAWLMPRGLGILAKSFSAGTALWQRSSWPRWAVLVVILGSVATFYDSNDLLRTKYLRARRHAGNFRLNKKIAELTAMDGSVLTSYLPLTIQPGFAKKAVYDGVPLRDDSGLQTRFSTHRWLVVEETLPDAEEAVRQRLLKNGTIFELAREGGFVLYQNATSLNKNNP